MEYLVSTLKKNFPHLAEKILWGLEQERPVSIKLNPYKIPASWNFELGNQVPWALNAFYLKERPQFVQDPLWHAGAYYVQEASSMFLDFIIQKILATYSETNGWRILDLCAAPGGKTLSLASNFPLDTLIVANEIDNQRVNALIHNITVSGFPNIYITNQKPEDFLQEPFFHLILIDAPCSGEGMYRKHSNLLKNNLNFQYVNTCSKLQHQILNSALRLLYPGGFLIYSTCTFNLIENEYLIHQFLSENPDFECIYWEVPNEWNVYVNEYKNVKFYRFFPGLLEGEGFSITILRKKGELALNQNTPLLKKDKHKTDILVQNHIKNANDFSFFSKNHSYFAILKKHFQDWQYLQSELKLLKNGIFIGTLKGKDFIPAHEWALSLSADISIYPHLELTQNQAIEYYQKKTLNFNSIEMGLHILKHQRISIGLAKKISNRWNNLLPNTYKIRINLM